MPCLAIISPVKCRPISTGIIKYKEGDNMSKKWWRAALIRAVRTFAEAVIAYIGTGAIVLGDVNWIAALSAGAMGAIMAILIAMAGLPEVDE